MIKMHKHSFLPFLKTMQEIYDIEKVDTDKYKWFMSRTDEVAVNVLNNTVTIVCQGTEPKVRDWFQNLWAFSREWGTWGRVHGGFAKNISRVLGRENDKNSLISFCLSRISEGYKVQLLGHSRGAVLAALLATKLIDHGVFPQSIRVILCASPKLGDAEFKTNYDLFLNERTYQIANKKDPVGLVPWLGHKLGRITYVSLGFLPRHRVVHYIKNIEGDNAK